MKKEISGAIKMYTIYFSVEGKKLHGTSHGLNEDEAKELFKKRNPEIIIIKAEEIKLIK